MKTRIAQPGLTIFALFTLLLVLAAPARAEKTGETEISIGLGGAVSTSLYKSYDTRWTPLPVIGFENDWAYIRGLEAGFKILNLEYLEFSAFVGYDPTSFDSADTGNNRLRRLDDRHSSALAGLEAQLLTPYGMFFVRGAADILGQSDGFVGEVGYKQSLEFGPLEFVPAFGLYWANSDYNDYYYGVSGKEARRSGLERYRAGSDFSPYLGLSVDWELNEHWDIFCHGQVTFAGSEVRDSPMVGESYTKSLNFGVVYNF